jgi:hypothetical protein
MNRKEHHARKERINDQRLSMGRIVVIRFLWQKAAILAGLPDTIATRAYVGLGLRIAHEAIDKNGWVIR